MFSPKTAATSGNINNITNININSGTALSGSKEPEVKMMSFNESLKEL